MEPGARAKSSVLDVIGCHGRDRAKEYEVGLLTGSRLGLGDSSCFGRGPLGVNNRRGRPEGSRGELSATSPIIDDRPERSWKARAGGE